MITLSPAQEEAKKWLLAHPNGAILADEAGVGKSYPAAMAALERGGSCLMVLPGYLIDQWYTYLVDDLGVDPKEVVRTDGTPHERVKAFKNIPGCRFFLTSYHTLAQQRRFRDGIKTWAHPELFDHKWATVLCDEAHRLRTRDTYFIKALRQLRSPWVAFWFLTGTPIYTNPGDMWPLLNLIAPHKFRGYWPFIEEHCIIEETPWNRRPVAMQPGSNFRQLIEPWFMRRTLEEAGIDIAKPIVYKHVISIDPKFKKQHDQLRTSYCMVNPITGQREIATGAGAMIVKLRQFTASLPEKLAALQGLLEDNEEPVIVFTWYRESRDMIGQRLKLKGRAVITVPEKVTERQPAVDMWKMVRNGVLVGTMGSMGEGLNLQHAAVIVFFEEDWTEAAMAQAIARARRRGQQGQVRVHHLMCKGTIDTLIHKVWNERGALSEQALAQRVAAGET